MSKIEYKNWAAVHNETLEALSRSRLGVNEYNVIFCILRKTLGFKKLFDRIPGSQIVKMTGINKGNVSRTIKSLIKKGIIIRNGGKIGININYSRWEKLSPEITNKKISPEITGDISKDNKKLSPEKDSKDTQKKLSPKKENFYKKMSSQEIDKLEGDPWYRAIMYNQGKFSIFYIEGTVDDYQFKTRMNCWYTYQEARYIRNKEAYFSKLLREYSEEE